MKHRLLQVLGWMLLATVFVPLVWDRHDTYWPWRVLSNRFGEVPFLARAFVVVPVLLGALVLLRDRLLPGRRGAVVLAVVAAFGCVSIIEWGPRLLAGLGGRQGFAMPVAGVVMVAGLVLVFGYGLAKGYAIAAAGGVVGLAAAFVPLAELGGRFGQGKSVLVQGAWAAASADGGKGSLLPLLLVGLGVLVCLAAVSLLVAPGRPLRARIVAWSLPVVFLMGSSLAVATDWGPSVERYSGWLGWFITRFCPMAVVLGVAVAELVAGSHAPVGSGSEGEAPPRRMTASECARRLRLLRDRERDKRLAPETARAQRVETLRAAVSAARVSPVATRALLEEVYALEKDGSLPAVEAASVRKALKAE